MIKIGQIDSYILIVIVYGKGSLQKKLTFLNSGFTGWTGWTTQDLRFQNFNFVLVYLFFENFKNDLDSKVDNFESTDDREPSEKSQSSPNGWNHVHKLGSSVLGYNVKCGCIKVDSNIFPFNVSASHTWILYKLLDKCLI